MRTLIVGGTSSVGAALKRALRDGHEAITAGRSGCDLVVDLASEAPIALPSGLDAVVQTAAHFGGKGIADVIEAERVNVIGTLRVCRAAIEAGAKHFVYVSSQFAQLDAQSPQFSAYALSKRHAEEALRFACALHSMPLAIIRPSQIYGEGESFRRHQPFVYTMIDKAQAGEDITLWGKNDARRNYVHVDDIGRILAAVVEKRVVGTFACASSNDQTYSQIARAAIAAFGSASQVRFLADKPDIPDNVFDRDDALYRAIGFAPAISIDEGMARIARSRREAR